jgi:hypothetical protein
MMTLCLFRIPVSHFRSQGGSFQSSATGSFFPSAEAEYQTLLEDAAKDEEYHESEDDGPNDPIA